MSVCANAVPLEEGAVTRRPGTRFIAYTKGGAPAAVWKFGFTASAPYNLEFTPGYLRFSYGPSLVIEPSVQTVVSFSTPPVWSGLTTYAANAVVQTVLGLVYFSVAAGNLNNDPTADVGGVNWTLVGSASCLVTTQTAHGWNNGNEVQFFLPEGDLTDFGTVTLLNRQFLIQAAGPTAFMIVDSVTGAPISASSLSIGPGGLQVGCVLMFVTPYAASELHQIRVVQSVNNEVNQLFIFHPNHQPIVLTATASPNAALNAYASFTGSLALFQDGPYLEPPASGAALTPTGLTGVVTLSITLQGWSGLSTYGVGDVVSYNGSGYTSLIDSNLNNVPGVATLAWQVQTPGADIGPSGFVTTDLGRLVRLFSEPAQWAAATAYVTGNVVKFDGSYWTALQGNTGAQPGLDVVNWAVNPTGAIWTWGRIQTVVSATQVTLQLHGGNLLYSSAIQTWQMGRYSDTTGWPSNGTYDDEGRLWIVGLQGNHFDASMSNQTLTFSPTAQDGTVADNNAIAETLNDKEVDAIFWLMLSHGGIVLGTQGGEWLVQASALNEPITPTSVQARKVTKYGQENIQPEHGPLALLTVQRYARKLLEYIADPYTGKFSATNIGIKASQLIEDGGGIAKIAYQQERTPVLWAQLNNGSLIGMTYRRDSPFGTQPATFAAWHQHTLGSGNVVLSICGGAAAGGQTDCLTLVTQNPTTGLCQLELLTPFFDEDQDITDAWYLDAADTPALVQLNPSGLVGVRLYGYHYLAGQTVQVWAAGLDMGNLPVAADGHIDLAFGSDPTGAFTLARLISISTNYQALFPDQASFIFNGGTPPPPIPSTAGLTEFLPTFGTISTPAIDWANGVLYARTSTAAYVAYSLTTRAVTASFPQNTLGTVLSSGVVGTDGDVYTVSGGSNGNPFYQLDPSAHRAIAYSPATLGTAVHPNTAGQAYVAVPNTVTYNTIFFGTQNANLTSNSNGICAPRSAAVVFAGHEYYVQANLVGQYGGANKAQITVVDGTEVQFVTNFTGGLNFANVVAGRSTNNGNGTYYGEVFSIQSNVDSNGDLISTPLQLWRLSITLTPPGAPVFSWTQISSIPASAIDPTWTGVCTTMGIAFDSTDNNILAFATSSGATHNCYLYKINSVTGVVMWAIPIPNPNVDDLLWPQSLIQGGRLGLLAETGGQNSNFYWIDTIGGTILSTTPLVSLVFFGSQAWGPAGLVLYHGDYEYVPNTPGVPAPIAPATTAGFTNGTGMFLGMPAVPAAPLVIPVIAGYTYTSQVQILRPIAPQESGARNGPALGKTRRTHHVAYLFHNSQGVSYGTDFGASLHACNFMLNATSVTPLPLTSLYSDIYWDSIEDDYTFNGQPTFQVTRPYPATCLAIEAFLHTQDR